MGNSFLQILLGFLKYFQASLGRTVVFESQGVSRCYLGVGLEDVQNFESYFLSLWVLRISKRDILKTDSY